MKKGLLFLMLSVLTLGAWAQTSPYTGVAVGNIVSGNDYYLYNVESGLWLQNNDRKANDWTPRAQLGSRGLDIAFVEAEGGGYKLNAKFGDPTINRDNMYLDNDVDHVWVFEPISNSVSNAVTMRSATRYFVADRYTAQYPYNNMYKVGEPNTEQWYLNNPENNSTNGTWQIVTKEERLEKMLAAGATQPVDATWLVKSPDFANDDSRLDSWIRTGTHWKRGGDANGDWGRGSMILENWNSDSSEGMYQTLEVPNGEYEFTFQGYYRDGDQDDIGTTYANGNEQIRAKYYANGVEAFFRSIIHPDHQTALTNPDRWPYKTGDYYVPNSMEDASRCINIENAYHNTPIRVKVTNGNLTIGVKKTGQNEHDWIVIDNVKLTYLGPLSDGNSPQNVTFAVHGGSNGCSKAFDSNLETKWTSTSSDSYVDIEASTAIRLTGFTLVTADNNETNGVPGEWEFYGSNEASALDNKLGTWTNWTLLEDVRNETTVQKKNHTAYYYAINAPSTPYKYFRLKFVTANWELSEIIPAYGPEYQPPYTALDGYGNAGESFYNLFDNNTGSKWCKGDWGEGSSADDALWWVVFKTSSPIAVSGYTFTTANDADGRDPKNWKLYGSNAESQPGREDASWVEIDSKENQTFTTNRYTDQHFDVSSPTGTTYKYFKLEITKVRNDGNMTQISEFKLDGLGYTEAEDKLIYYRSMSTWSNDQTGASLFDGNPETKFGGNFTTDGYGAYVTFGPASQEPISITGYSLQVASEWGYYERIPKSWILYGGNNANTPESTWEEIHSVTNDVQLYRDVSYKALTRGYYHLDAPSKPYKYFKIVFTENNGDGGLQLGELVLYYPHEKVWTNNMELREETSPVFNGVVTVKNAKIKRNITAGKWIGLCLPFDYDIPSGWDVRELDHVDGSGESASMKFASASSIEAGKPYIVKTGSDVTEISVTDKTFGTPASSVSDNGVNMIGNIGQTTIPEGSFYISNQGELKKLVGNDATLKGFRAYFTIDSSSPVKALSFDFDDDATGISLMEDGRSQMEDGAIYNLAGQRLSKTQKGINIVNGKKILK